MPLNTLKPLYLLDILRSETDEEHRLTVPQLADMLGARGITTERKSLYRYLDALSEYGYDIVKTGTGYYLGARDYEIWELRLLASAIQAASFVTKARSEALLSKLSSHLSRYQAQDMLGTSIGGVKCGTDEIYRTIEAVNLSIATRRQITFAYYKKDINRRSVMQHGGERYRVSPYAMVWVQDRYYLVCNAEGHEGLTHFRLDRIRSVRMEQQPWRHFSEVCEYKTAFDVSDYAAKCVNMFGGTPEQITLSCDMDLVTELMDRFGEDIPTRLIAHDRFTCTVLAVPNRGFLQWAAQFGARIEILSPDTLREQLREHLAEALKRYSR